MINGTDFNAKFCCNSQCRLWHILAFFELLKTSIEVFLKQVFHALSEHNFTLFLLIREACQPDHFATVDVESSSEHLEPVIRIGSSDQIKWLFPVDELALANSLLA